MGNISPQVNSNRSETKDDSLTQYNVLKKSRSLRDYTRTTTLMNTSGSTRTKLSLPRPKSLAPTDAEIIDIRTLRLAEMSSEDGTSLLNKANLGENHLKNQLEYIQSCVRKDKGLFGMMTENLQSKHIFSNHEPENTHILERTPEDFNMDYESIYLQTLDGEFIHAYWIHQSGDVNSTLTFLYLHGAGGNVSHRLEVLRLFYENLHCNILIIDYRGL